MASRISQMRNGMYPQQQQTSQQPAIEEVRGMMQKVKNAQNPQAALAQIIQNNPNSAFIASALHNGNNLEGIARSMAQAKGIDINQLINQLSEGI